jgi:hypothetical protein
MRVSPHAESGEPMRWLYDIPDWLLAVLVIGAIVALSIGGYVVTRPLRSRAANDVSGAVLGMVGLVHGILLALVAVAAWGNYTAAGDAAERETAALANMHRHLQGYPEPERQQLDARLRGYLDLVLTDEWPALRRGRSSVRTERARDALARDWIDFDPRPGREQLLYAATERELEEFLDARRARIAAGRAGLPRPLWAVALLGTALTIGCTYFLRTDDERAQILMTTIVAAMLGLLIFLILVLDHPVWGTQGIRPDTFAELLHFVAGR